MAASWFSSVLNRITSWRHVYPTQSTDGVWTGQTQLPMNQERAMRVAAVYGCLRILSVPQSIFPAEVFERTPRGLEPLPFHSAWRVLNLHANPSMMPAHEFRAWAVANAVHFGNSYAEVQRNKRGEVIGFWPLQPDRVEPYFANEPDQPDPNGEKMFYKITMNPGGRGDVILDSDHMFHMRNPLCTRSSGLGTGILTSASSEIGYAKDLQEHGDSFIRQGARPGLILKTAKKMSPEDRREMQEAWRRGFSGPNNGRTAILHEGVDVQAIAVNNAEAQFLESREFSTKTIAQFYGVPLALLGEETSIDSAEELGRIFVPYVLAPITYAMQTEFTRLMLPKPSQQVLIDTAQLTEGNLDKKLDQVRSMLTLGWGDYGEVRRIFRLPPMEHDEKRLVQGAMITLETALLREKAELEAVIAAAEFNDNPQPDPNADPAAPAPGPDGPPGPKSPSRGNEGESVDAPITQPGQNRMDLVEWKERANFGSTIAREIARALGDSASALFAGWGATDTSPANDGRLDAIEGAITRLTEATQLSREMMRSMADRYPLAAQMAVAPPQDVRNEQLSEVEHVVKETLRAVVNSTATTQALIDAASYAPSTRDLEPSEPVDLPRVQYAIDLAKQACQASERSAAAIDRLVDWVMRRDEGDSHGPPASYPAPDVPTPGWVAPLLDRQTDVIQTIGDYIADQPQLPQSQIPRPSENIAADTMLRMERMVERATVAAEQAAQAARDAGAAAPTTIVSDNTPVEDLTRLVYEAVHALNRARSEPTDRDREPVVTTNNIEIIQPAAPVAAAPPTNGNGHANLDRLSDSIRDQADEIRGLRHDLQTPDPVAPVAVQPAPAPVNGSRPEIDGLHDALRDQVALQRQTQTDLLSLRTEVESAPVVRAPVNGDRVRISQLQDLVLDQTTRQDRAQEELNTLKIEVATTKAGESEPSEWRPVGESDFRQLKDMFADFQASQDRAAVTASRSHNGVQPQSLEFEQAVAKLEKKERQEQAQAVIDSNRDIHAALLKPAKPAETVVVTPTVAPVDMTPLQDGLADLADGVQSLKGEVTRTGAAMVTAVDNHEVVVDLGEHIDGPLSEDELGDAAKTEESSVRKQERRK